jgi:hypothetical protein
MSHKHTILVTVQGGVIQNIDDIPTDVRVVVRDYDVDGIDESKLEEDQDGHRFVESTWD